MAKWESVNEIKFDDIVEYCKKNKQVDWLKEVALKEGLTNKNGKERKVSFIELRNEFCRKFFPDLAPQSKPKKPSMYEVIAGL